MIISASRRTDIPALYPQWMMNRLREGYVLIPNPRNPNSLGRVTLSPELVDCIVFWTKNPSPMFAHLNTLETLGYPYYIQFTLNPYDKSIERGLPDKRRLIEDFIKLSERIGARRLVWRYDPIFIDAIHSTAWHMEQFSALCQTLSSYTIRCVISFTDIYPSRKSHFRAMTEDEMLTIAQGFSHAASGQGIELLTCAEAIDLSFYGIGHASCVDRELIESLIGYPITSKKDTNQREACGCVESIDIGAYDTCIQGCSYCYAVSSQKTAQRRAMNHNPAAPMLTGWPRGHEHINERGSLSHKDRQLKML